MDNFLPLSHLLKHDQRICPVEELCLAALKLAMTLQLVPEHTEKHLVVCRDGLSLGDHPDQEVIGHQQQSSTCRKISGG